jgi:hypothetical protein
MSIKQGDRVAVYSELRRETGKVLAYNHENKNDRPYILLDNGIKINVHPKQCRRLISKTPKRRIWLPKDPEHVPRNKLYSALTFWQWLMVEPPESSKTEWLEFIEVRRKYEDR